MQMNGIHHINIGCRESDLPAIEKFYCEGLGLHVGYRPNFPSGGLWLYHGDHPLVHVVTRFKADWTGLDESKSSYDHTAYAVKGVQDFRARFRKMGIPFEEQNVPNAGFQMFLRDPVGNKVELNFPNEEAPAEVASGMLAAMQFPDHAGKR
jgi:catechol 2,3-dioxygenase-like lactoylglutathione lyase family enzyme